MGESIKTQKKGINPLATTVLGASNPDESDFQKHVDYIHYNPVKHRLVKKVSDWPYSTFHRYVGQGVHDTDWAGVLHKDDLMGFGE